MHASPARAASACDGLSGSPCEDRLFPFGIGLALEPVRLARPVSNSYSTTPSEYTSVMVVTGSPRICSGAA
jgi:hypothetical protein